MHEQQLEEGERAGVSLAELLHAVQTVEPAAQDADRIDQIRLLEEIKSAAAAVQAQVTAVRHLGPGRRRPARRGRSAHPGTVDG